MRGGKREGAGRKSLCPTKTIRIPIALESQISTLVKEYKESLAKDKARVETVTKSKDTVKPAFPTLNKDQLKRFREWLCKFGFAKSITHARKMTETPRLCYDTFDKYIPWGDERRNQSILDVMDLYYIE